VIDHNLHEKQPHYYKEGIQTVNLVYCGNGRLPLCVCYIDTVASKGTLAAPNVSRKFSGTKIRKFGDKIKNVLMFMSKML